MSAEEAEDCRGQAMGLLGTKALRDLSRGSIRMMPPDAGPIPRILIRIVRLIFPTWLARADSASRANPLCFEPLSSTAKGACPYNNQA